MEHRVSLLSLWRTLALALVAMILTSGCVEESREQHVLEIHDALLLELPYSKVTVEIDRIDGIAPYPEALAILERALKEVAGKHHVRMIADAPHPARDPGLQARVWTVDEVWQMHEQTFGLGLPHENGRGDAAFLHVLYLDGWGTLDGETIGGMSFRNTITIWPEAFAKLTVGSQHVRSPEAAEIEVTVMLHELGHAMGLVHNPLPMHRARETLDPPNHSTLETSPLFAEVHGRDSLLKLVERRELPSWYDAHDLQDIRGYQERARTVAGT